MANAISNRNLNYQQCMHITAVDIDIKAVHMCYIQLSLMGIPAVVIHGNPLTLEEWSSWYTPFHILNGWSSRLENRKNPPPDLTLNPGKVFTKDDQDELF